MRQSDTQRWNLATQWAISAEPAHPALVSEADFVAVQEYPHSVTIGASTTGLLSTHARATCPIDRRRRVGALKVPADERRLAGVPVGCPGDQYAGPLPCNRVRRAAPRTRALDCGYTSA